MPSVYHSCTITDEATEALSAFKQHLDGVKDEFDTQLATLATAVSDLEGAPQKASATIGDTVDNQVTWTAKNAGRAGNKISINYVYVGPEYDSTLGTTVARNPSSEVQDTAILLYLSAEPDGSITVNTNDHLTFWLANSDVTDLVDASVVGAGTDFPEAYPTEFLSGGKDGSVKQAETASNQVAEVFGEKDYKTFLNGLDIPVIESKADAEAYLQEGDEYVVVNGKLLIIDGTNLVGLNKLYELYDQDLDKVKSFVADMKSGLPRLITTQNISKTTYDFICGENQPFVTVTETLRDLDTNVVTSKNKWGGDQDSFNHYIFWGVAAKSSQASMQRLLQWGISEDYLGDILTGEDPEDSPSSEINTPTVFTVESLTLLSDLLFTDDELHSLLQKDVAGIKIPHKTSLNERLKALDKIFTRKPSIRENGMRDATKAPVVAMQAIDAAKVTDDQNLAKELATRGKACARSSNRLDQVADFNIPDLPGTGLPEVPFDRLPDPAKKIESAFGALSNGVSAANRVFDTMVGSLTDTVGGILNKIQSASSLADNLFDNDLAECLLGSGTPNTGVPEFTGVGDISGSTGSIPKVEDVFGGLPIPEAALQDAMEKLSAELDETVTDAFESLMKTIQVPLCIVQKLMSEFSGGIDLGGLLNPCKEQDSPDDKCPAEGVQEIIDASSDLTSALSTIPSLADAPTTEAVTTVEEEVQQFIGTIKTTETTTEQDVTRGIQEVMDEISQSIEAKTDMIDQFDKSIREMFSETREKKVSIDEDAKSNSSCFPSVAGLFSDAISEYI